MTTFSTPELFKQPVLQWDPNKKDFLLVEPWCFEWGDLKGIRKQLYIPAGQDYDKASVPKLAWGFFRPDGPWEAASLAHDMLYKYKGRLPAGWYQTFAGGKWVDGSPWSRKEADDMLEYLGILGGASKQEAALYKWAVKLYPANYFKGF